MKTQIAIVILVVCCVAMCAMAFYCLRILHRMEAEGRAFANRIRAEIDQENRVRGRRPIDESEYAARVNDDRQAKGLKPIEPLKQPRPARP